MRFFGSKPRILGSAEDTPLKHDRFDKFFRYLEGHSEDRVTPGPSPANKSPSGTGTNIKLAAYVRSSFLGSAASIADVTRIVRQIE